MSCDNTCITRNASAFTAKASTRPIHKSQCCISRRNRSPARSIASPYQSPTASRNAAPKPGPDAASSATERAREINASRKCAGNASARASRRRTRVSRSAGGRPVESRGTTWSINKSAKVSFASRTGASLPGVIIARSVSFFQNVSTTRLRRAFSSGSSGSAGASGADGSHDFTRARARVQPSGNNSTIMFTTRSRIRRPWLHGASGKPVSKRLIVM